MSSWIFIVTNQNTDSGPVSAEDIFRVRMNDEFWGLEAKTPNRRNLETGDKIVFYVGNPIMVFAGTAGVSGPAFQLTDIEREKYGHRQELYDTEYGVKLTDINQWSDYKSAKDLVPNLQFVQNKESWGSYFQGGIRFLPDEDYSLITSQRPVPLSSQFSREPDLESEADFALEKHLEDFIYNNWGSISFGLPLELYKTAEASGRQFPAGKWSIDFLCRNKETDDLVVLELKRGKTSDSVIGQLARYMVWVTENMAIEGQDVHGIVIAKEIDEALRLAIKIHPNMHVLTYKVDFHLKETLDDK